MAGAARLLERLAGMMPVAAAEVLELIERLSEPQSDPVIGPLFGMDDEGEAVVNPPLPPVPQQFPDKPELPRYVTLLQRLPSVLPSPVRPAVCTRTRAARL